MCSDKDERVVYLIKKKTDFKNPKSTVKPKFNNLFATLNSNFEYP